MTDVKKCVERVKCLAFSVAKWKLLDSMEVRQGCMSFVQHVKWPGVNWPKSYDEPPTGVAPDERLVVDERPIGHNPNR